jgi:hypothetical protein
MRMTTGPPFRADHVGSLLRPPELREARARARAGEISAAATGMTFQAEDVPPMATITGQVRCAGPIMVEQWRMNKDLETFNTIAKELHVPVSFATVAQRYQQAALAAGLGESDTSAVLQIIERLAAFEIPRGEAPRS